MRVSRVKFRQSCSDWKNKDSPPDSDGFGNNSFMLSNKETCAALSTFPLPYGIDSSPASVAVLSFVEWERLIYSLAQLRRQVKMDTGRSRAIDIDLSNR